MRTSGSILTQTALKKLTLLCFTCLLAACSTSPKIHALYEQGIDYSQYSTFSFAKELTPEGEEYNTLVEKYLKQAIALELQARGVQQVTPAGDSDLLVNFNISTQEKIQRTRAPSLSMGYYSYRGRPGYSYGLGYGTDYRVSQYTEGTLNIDVVDRARKQLVWEGVAVGRMKTLQPETMETEINEVVSSIFAEYPVSGPIVPAHLSPAP